MSCCFGVAEIWREFRGCNRIECLAVPRESHNPSGPTSWTRKTKVGLGLDWIGGPERRLFSGSDSRSLSPLVRSLYTRHGILPEWWASAGRQARQATSPPPDEGRRLEIDWQVSARRLAVEFYASVAADLLLCILIFPVTNHCILLHLPHRLRFGGWSACVVALPVFGFSVCFVKPFRAALLLSFDFEAKSRLSLHAVAPVSEWCFLPCDRRISSRGRIVKWTSEIHESRWHTLSPIPILGIPKVS